MSVHRFKVQRSGLSLFISCFSQGNPCSNHLQQKSVTAFYFRPVSFSAWPLKAWFGLKLEQINLEP